MAIKSKELAKMLGVSTATISLVLNNKPGISEELRKKLLKRIKEMGYGYMIREEEEDFPEESAQNVKNIAFVIYVRQNEEDTDAVFFPPVMEGTEREARHRGFHMSIFHMNREKGDRLGNYVRKEDYAGIIVYADQLDDQISRELEETQIPYVMLDCYNPAIDACTVDVNNEQGIYAAIDYLLKKGHREIGYVSSGSRSDSYMERHRFFHYAMQDYGLAEWPDYDIVTNCWGQAAQEYLEKIWSDMRPPTALLVENDVLALSVYRALKSVGYRIPEDVSVIGFDGRNICSIMEPTLTTMRIPRRFFGRTLVMLLEWKINLRERGMEEVPVKMEIDVELVEMDSVRTLTDASGKNSKVSF